MESNTDLTDHDVSDCLKKEQEKNVSHLIADANLSEDAFVQFNEDTCDENEEIFLEMFDEDEPAETNFSGRYTNIIVT